MKKDIYVIRNTVNDKCYVGQSTDYLYRFRKHKEEARRNNYKYKSVLYNAMNSIGIDKFYVELLEPQVENYNEREIYWINKLNTIRPNGYNLANGGDWYPHLKDLLHHDAKIKTEEELMSIYDELLHTDLSLSEIGKNHTGQYNVIYDIKNGHTYKRDGYTYPLREFTISKGNLDRLTFDLKYSNYSYDELAEMYHLSKNQIKAINYGNSLHREYLTYPLRRCAFGSKSEADSVEKIQKDLLSTQLSYEEIAAKYNCAKQTVIRINFGETHRNDNLRYPLRNMSNRLSQQMLNYIHDRLLNSDDSINDIAKYAGISDASVKRINSGETKRYRDPSLNYPLRPM